SILGQAYITFADQYGDRRIQIFLDSIDTFSNFMISYYNLEPRIQWGVSVYDSRQYYIAGYDPLTYRPDSRQQLYRYSAAEFSVQYPLSTYFRLTGRAGYLDRQYDQPIGQNPETGDLITVQSKNQSPYIGVGAAGDTTHWKRYGPHKGVRWEGRLYYAYDTDDGGALTKNVEFDGRYYVPTSARTELAFRTWVGWANGNQPWIYSFGGMDNLRGYPTYSLSGNRTAFVNLEWRFPLVDRMDLAFLRLGGIRGRIFLDVGAAWYENANGDQFNMFGDPGFEFWDDDRVLKDGVSSYGFGLDVYMFGLPMHVDWVKIWDFDEAKTGWRSDFWVGMRF
ncbi:MAG: hypothetical protein IFK92_14435, partial [Acidobacteria bacterium]|nr:hypothetical protein [Candidatus Sulfomarinibacter kjeldsenii]